MKHILYSDNLISIIFEDSKYLFNYEDKLNISMYLDIFMKFAKGIDYVIKNETKVKIINDDNGIIEIEKVIDKLNIIYTDYNNTTTIININQDIYLLLPTLLSRIIKFFPLHYTIVKTPHIYFEKSKLNDKLISYSKIKDTNIIIDRENNIENEEVDKSNYIIPIQLWTPYEKEDDIYDMKIGIDIDEEKFELLKGLVSLFILTELKNDNIIIEINKVFETYLNHIIKYRKNLTLEKLSLIHDNILKFLNDPMDINNSIDVRRILSKYKDLDITKYFFIKIIKTENIIEKIHIFCIIYLINCIIDDQELIEQII